MIPWVVETAAGGLEIGVKVLSAGQWDVTIDVCGYFPRQVRMLAEALGGRGGRYIYISSTSAYKTPVSSGFDEDAPLAFAY